LGIDVAAERVSLLAGRRVSEEHADVAFADSGLEEARRLEPAGGASDLEVEPADPLGATLVSARREDDDRLGLGARRERQLEAVGEVDREILQSLVLLESRTPGIENDDGGEPLVGQPQHESPDLESRGIDRRLAV